jgi:hypothetical protein
VPDVTAVIVKVVDATLTEAMPVGTGDAEKDPL